jgi:4-amino-4-deoxy-L-arabinose transferase-like glycosyltransferase
MTDHAPYAYEDEADEWREGVLITIAATLIRLFIGLRLGAFPDETYYWDWSRHLAAGYFDHPPAIAWMISPGNAISSLFGVQASAFSVRFFPVIAGGFAAYFAMLTARRLGDGGNARRIAMLFALMPIAASGLILATPDAPLLAASAATIYCVVRALQANRNSGESLKWWSLGGLSLGLAFLSKYTAILLPVALLIAMLVRPRLRPRLAEPGPYVACIIATLVFLPVLYWNFTHDWVSFRFQLGHGLGPPRGSLIKRELDLIGGQFFLVSPVLFMLAVVVTWKVLRKTVNDIHFALASISLVSFLFFVVSATRRSVEPNWPAPAYIPAMILLSLLLKRHSDWLRRAMGLAGLITSMIYVQALVTIMPIPARKDPVARAAGWERYAAYVQGARNVLTASEGDTWVGSDRYQDVSELSFHMAQQPTTICTCLTGRRNQYEFWPGFPQLAKRGDNLILAIEDTSEAPAAPTRLRAHFTTVTRGELVPLLRGRDTAGVRRLWRLTDYRGGWPARTPP